MFYIYNSSSLLVEQPLSRETTHKIFSALAQRNNIAYYPEEVSPAIKDDNIGAFVISPKDIHDIHDTNDVHVNYKMDIVDGAMEVRIDIASRGTVVDDIGRMFAEEIGGTLTLNDGSTKDYGHVNISKYSSGATEEAGLMNDESWGEIVSDMNKNPFLSSLGENLQEGLVEFQKNVDEEFSKAMDKAYLNKDSSPKMS